MKSITFIVFCLFISGCSWKKLILPLQKKPESKKVTKSNEEKVSPKVDIKSDTEVKSNVEQQNPPSQYRTNEEFCGIINERFDTYRWNKIRCIPDRWEIYGYSVQGNPLFYQTFGFDDPENTGPVNLFMCGIHGDEETSIYLCFHLVREILFDNPDSLKDFKIVVAPLVNPDGFLAGTRVNANGVDPNRNLPTKDWNEKAIKTWARYKNDPRRNPGMSANSEIESQFQIFLLEKYTPDKIISVHAPYGILDYDGPSGMKYYNLVRIEQRAAFLALNMEANSNRFLKVVKFGFFPGSLGNYAGNERKIPTYTLELPSTKIKNADHYWSSLRFAILKALAFKVYDGDGGNPFASAQQKLAEKEGLYKEETVK